MARRPEDQARDKIDEQLARAGWIVQDEDDLNLQAGRGVAVREFPMNRGFGRCDYLLFLDAIPVGALEAKKAGFTLSGVELQIKKYSEGLPTHLRAQLTPLPFLYLSTGVETSFTNGLDPNPRSRRVYAPHRPETLFDWLNTEPLRDWIQGFGPRPPQAQAGAIQQQAQPEFDPKPSTIRGRLCHIPQVDIPGLWKNQIRAIRGIEKSLAENRPRSLVQMATGSGKSLTSVVAIYRQIKFGGARRVLFLVDRKDLADQAKGEFETYRTYDDHRKFTELYNVQQLTSNSIASSARVVITTVQRLYSMLRGEQSFDPKLEEISAFDHPKPPEPVRTLAYDSVIPPEFFDFIYIDECHRSIYSLWRQVIEYFDAFLIGLTATPAKHTFGFFNQNLVTEYRHEQAVADGVNVDFDVYPIRTKITEHGGFIEANERITVPIRDRQTRAMRWETPDEDISYTAGQLDGDVVATDQIRLVIQTFKERLFTEIFPGRTHVPKTLIFAKDDSHAEDIVAVVRREFAAGNDFCTKITYKSTGKKPKQLLQDFRISFYPRIAVTVDMVTTGIDVKPIEVVMFMRTVKSRGLFEQMKGRGVRVIGSDDLRAVTPDAQAKTHFVIVDCVGVMNSPMNDTRPLETQRSVPFKKLLTHVAHGSTDPPLISSLASRLARLEKKLARKERERVKEVASGFSLAQINRALVDALDTDRQVEWLMEHRGLSADSDPEPEQLEEAARALIQEAASPLAGNPKLRKLLLELKQQHDQIIDEISQDQLLEAGMSAELREQARELVQSFESYLAEHKDEIDALQFFYSQPYDQRLDFASIKALADAISAPPQRWTPERLWRAYEQLDADRVRGAGGQRLLTDLVSLVRFALHQDEELVPYGSLVQERFSFWLMQQRNGGRNFTEEQEAWLKMMRDHVAQSLGIELDDFELTPFVEQGGLGRAAQLFGRDLRALLDELNEVLVA